MALTQSLQGLEKVWENQHLQAPDEEMGGLDPPGSSALASREEQWGMSNEEP